MEFTDHQIRAFATGVDRVESLPLGWRLHRLPADLQALYPSDGGRARARCTVCVRLRFVTDACWIRITLKYGEPARWYFSCANVLDDKRVEAFGPITHENSWDGLVFHQKARARHLHDIWLPHLCGADVLRLELEDGCTVEPAPALPMTWLAYGDSITQGMNASQPVFPWVARAAREWNANVVNYGVGGATLQRELADCRPEANPDLITVSYGANDWNIDVPLDRFSTNASALLESLQQNFPTARLVVTTPIPFFRATGPNKTGATLDDFRRILEELATAAGLQFLRGLDLVPADHNYFYDWSHPNDSGMALYAQNFTTALRHLRFTPATAVP